MGDATPLGGGDDESKTSFRSHFEAVAFIQLWESMSAGKGTSAPGRHDLSTRTEDVFLPGVTELATYLI